MNLDKEGHFNLVANNLTILKALREAIISKAKSQSSKIPNSQNHAVEETRANHQEKTTNVNNLTSNPKISSNFDLSPKNKNLPNHKTLNSQTIANVINPRNTTVNTYTATDNTTSTEDKICSSTAEK